MMVGILFTGILGTTATNENGCSLSPFVAAPGGGKNVQGMNDEDGGRRGELCHFSGGGGRSLARKVVLFWGLKQNVS